MGFWKRLFGLEPSLKELIEEKDRKIADLVAKLRYEVKVEKQTRPKYESDEIGLASDAIDAAEAAKMLGITPRAIRDAATRGRVKVVRAGNPVPGGKTLYDRKSVEEYGKTRRNAGRQGSAKKFKAQPQPLAPEYINSKEAAQILGVKPYGMPAYMNRGAIKGKHVPRPDKPTLNLCLFEKADVERYAEQRFARLVQKLPEPTFSVDEAATLLETSRRQILRDAAKHYLTAYEVKWGDKTIKRISVASVEEAMKRKELAVEEIGNRKAS